MANHKSTKSKEWQEEEVHLKECRAVIAANIAEYKRQYEERHKETKALFDQVQSGNIELYGQMMTSRSLEEHSLNQLTNNQAAYEKPFLEGLTIAIWMKGCMSQSISENMECCETRQMWKL